MSSSSGFTSGGALLRARGRDQQVPGRGHKEAEATGSWLENKAVDARLHEHHQLLQEPRCARRDVLARGEWVAGSGVVAVVREAGDFWQHMGVETDIGKCLYPEEALYLLDTGELEVVYGDLPLSLQHGQTLMLRDSAHLDRYLVYSHLTRAGCKVVRHQPHLCYTKYEKDIRLDQHQVKKSVKLKLKHRGVEPAKQERQGAAQGMDTELAEFYASLGDEGDNAENTQDEAVPQDNQGKKTDREKNKKRERTESYEVSEYERKKQELLASFPCFAGRSEFELSTRDKDLYPANSTPARDSYTITSAALDYYSKYDNEHDHGGNWRNDSNDWRRNEGWRNDRYSSGGQGWRGNDRFRDENDWRRGGNERGREGNDRWRRDNDRRREENDRLRADRARADNDSWLHDRFDPSGTRQYDDRWEINNYKRQPGKDSWNHDDRWMDGDRRRDDMRMDGRGGAQRMDGDWRRDRDRRRDGDMRMDGRGDGGQWMGGDRGRDGDMWMDGRGDGGQWMGGGGVGQEVDMSVRPAWKVGKRRKQKNQRDYYPSCLIKLSVEVRSWREYKRVVSETSEERLLTGGPGAALWRGRTTPLTRPTQASSTQSVLEACSLGEVEGVGAGLGAGVGAGMGAGVGERQRLEVHYDAYLPSAPFKKTCPPPPSSRVIVLSDGQEPSPGQILEVTSRFQDEVAVVCALVVAGEVRLYQLAPTTLPHPTVNHPANT